MSKITNYGVAQDALYSTDVATVGVKWLLLQRDN